MYSHSLIVDKLYKATYYVSQEENNTLDLGYIMACYVFLISARWANELAPPDQLSKNTVAFTGFPIFTSLNNKWTEREIWLMPTGI